MASNILKQLKSIGFSKSKKLLNNKNGFRVLSSNCKDKTQEMYLLSVVTKLKIKVGYMTVRMPGSLLSLL